jgi:hypothetical protein
MVIQNDSDADIFLKFDGSDSLLTAANGLRLKAGSTITLDNLNMIVGKANNEVWAIHSSTGSKTLRIQECAGDGHELITI